VIISWQYPLILIALLFSVSAQAECNFSHANHINNLKNPKNIKLIDVKVPKSAKWQKNFIRIITSKSKNIPADLKKSFKAKIKIEYIFGECEFWGTVKQNGDWKDHINLVDNGLPVRSLNVKLDEGNILNSVYFKLLIPETRNGLKEIFGISILNTLGFITPETFIVNVTVNDVRSKMIFQEASRKELLERNGRREGPIFEGDETLLWGEDRLYNDDIALARLENKNYFLKGSSSESITLRAFKKLQAEYIKQTNNIPNRVIDPNASLEFTFLQNIEFQKYHFVMQALDADHGLIPHNRKFYFNAFENSFEPIYYDGNVLINNFSTNPSFNISYIENAYQDLNINKFTTNVLSEGVKKSASSFFFNRAKLPLNNSEALFNQYWEHFAYRVNALSNKISKEKLFNGAYKDINSEIAIFTDRAVNHPMIENLFIDLEKISSSKYSLKTKNKENIFNSEEVARILSKNSINGTRSTLLGFDLDQEKLVLKKLSFGEGEIIAMKGISIKINDKEKKITVLQNKGTDWILFNGVIFDDWSIKFVGVSDNSNIEMDQRFNEFGMTGCLNFYKTDFNNNNIEVIDGMCEDSLNIVDSSGEISSILIERSFADALDIDFSYVNISELKVNNAGNDCFDVSGGKYNITSALLKSCGDKGISVGEASRLISSNLNLSSSNIGISSKDLSIIDINKANITDVNICAEARQKKQEFGGAKIKLNLFQCDGAIENDSNSIILIKNS
jgi:hypothetical protein